MVPRRLRPSLRLRNERALTLALMIHSLFEKAANKDEPPFYYLSTLLFEETLPPLSSLNALSFLFSRRELLNFSCAFKFSCGGEQSILSSLDVQVRPEVIINYVTLSWFNYYLLYYASYWNMLHYQYIT